MVYFLILWNSNSHDDIAHTNSPQLYTRFMVLNCLTAVVAILGGSSTGGLAVLMSQYIRGLPWGIP